MATASDPLRGILSAYFSRAGLWFGISFAAQAFGILIGAASVLLDRASLELGMAVGAVSLSASGGRWRADTLRHRAEFLLRQVEYHDGFCWPLDNKLLADAISQAIPFKRSAEKRGVEQGNFFASSLPAGPSRALANLRESAWWTEQLCGYLGPRCAAACATITLLSLWSLLIAASLLRQSDPLAISSLLTATLCLIFSADFARLPIGVYQLGADARKAGTAASREEDGKPSDERSVLVLLHQYQIDRGKGPIIPDWAWRHRRDRLASISTVPDSPNTGPHANWRTSFRSPHHGIGVG